VREREIYASADISSLTHSSHHRLIGRGVPGLSSEFLLIYSFSVISPKKNPSPQMIDPGIEPQTYHFRFRHPNHEILKKPCFVRVRDWQNLGRVWPYLDHQTPRATPSCCPSTIRTTRCDCGNYRTFQIAAGFRASPAPGRCSAPR
jgi:hypothetical protein